MVWRHVPYNACTCALAWAAAGVPERCVSAEPSGDIPTCPRSDKPSSSARSWTCSPKLFRVTHNLLNAALILSLPEVCPVFCVSGAGAPGAGGAHPRLGAGRRGPADRGGAGGGGPAPGPLPPRRQPGVRVGLLTRKCLGLGSCTCKLTGVPASLRSVCTSMNSGRHRNVSQNAVSLPEHMAVHLVLQASSEPCAGCPTSA
jgi:hypothetical protein